jgi:2,3-bisphosphoglycerate-dependent phosphoglycerate mutase
VSTHLRLDAEIVADLAEQDYGSADGQPWAEVIAAYGNIPALDADRPLAPGGETWRDYLHRACAAIVQITSRHSGERALIIGHGETIDAAFHHFLALPATSRATAAIAAHNASLTTWEQQPLSWTRPGAGWRWTLTGHNDTRHLTTE